MYSEKEKAKSVEDRIGATMAHAGVAITITSVTNFIAFGIGASSSLPALRSFCVYASLGILIIFFFQVIIRFTNKTAVMGYVIANKALDNGMHIMSGVSSFDL